MSYKVFWGMEALALLSKQSIGALVKSLQLSIFQMLLKTHTLPEKYLEKSLFLESYLA